MQRLKRIHGDDDTYRMPRSFNYVEHAEGPLLQLPSSQAHQVRRTPTPVLLTRVCVSPEVRRGPVGAWRSH